MLYSVSAVLTLEGGDPQVSCIFYFCILMLDQIEASTEVYPLVSPLSPAAPALPSQGAHGLDEEQGGKDRFSSPHTLLTALEPTRILPF